MDFDYIIIGAGASGVVTAITAARRGKRVLLLEHKDRILKKVLVSGNGRCNFTNINASPSNYISEKKDFLDYLFLNFPPKKIISFFNELGIMEVEDKNGKMYPRSYQAASVVDALRNMLDYLGVRIELEYNTGKVYKKGDTFFVDDKYRANKLVIATGGYSFKELGSDGSGYEIAKSFGHSITELKPVMVQLKADKEYVKGLEGIRQDVLLKAIYKGNVLREDFGELLFTPYGISGPTVFNQSYLTAVYGFDVEFKIDFIPEIDKINLKKYLKNRRDTIFHLEAIDFLNGIVHKKLGMFLLKKSGLEKLNQPVYVIDDKIIDNLVINLKEYSVICFDTMGFKQAQVTAGGVNSKEIDEKKFESYKVKGLHIVGEALDVFGDCGGYNLQYAFASGMLVGSLDD